MSTLKKLLRSPFEIWSFLSMADPEALIRTTVSSRLDKCNVLLSDMLRASMKRLHMVQNSAARLRKFHQSAPISASLHWLLIHGCFWWPSNLTSHPVLYVLRIQGSWSKVKKKFAGCRSLSYSTLTSGITSWLSRNSSFHLSFWLVLILWYLRPCPCWHYPYGGPVSVSINLLTSVWHPPGD